MVSWAPQVVLSAEAGPAVAAAPTASGYNGAHHWPAAALGARAPPGLHAAVAALPWSDQGIQQLPPVTSTHGTAPPPGTVPLAVQANGMLSLGQSSSTARWRVCVLSSPCGGRARQYSASQQEPAAYPWATRLYV